MKTRIKLSVLFFSLAVLSALWKATADGQVPILSQWLSAIGQPGTYAGTTGYLAYGRNGTGDTDFVTANGGSSPSFYWYYLLGTTVTAEMWLDQSAILHVPDGIIANINGNLAGNASTATNVAYSGLTGSPPTWNQSTTGNAGTATQLAATPGQCAGPGPITGITASGTANCLYSSHFQIETDTFTTGLPAATSGSASYASSSSTITWPTAFFDINYSLACSYGVGAGVITGVSESNFTPTGFTVTIWNGTSSGAVASNINQLSCTAIHL